VKAVRFIIGAQLAITLVPAVAAWMLGDARVAWSILLGGAIGLAGAAVYARSIAASAGKSPGELVKAHYRAEVFKLALTVVLFAAVLTLYKDISTLALLLTFIATLVVYWIALLLV
jgi:ATP synthase protein I